MVHRIGSFLSVAWAACVLTGCGTYRITPPVVVLTPTTVYVVDLGNTSKLILPRFENGGLSGFDEFGFGDWEFYAKGNTSPIYAPFALLVPTGGTLTKREYRHDPAVWLDGSSEALHPIQVERRAATDLQNRLAERFAAGSQTQLGDPEMGLSFVRDPDNYWLFHQSSSVVAGWLRELGCRVTGWTLVADFSVHQTDRQ